jgi:hypothetical protein
VPGAGKRPAVTLRQSRSRGDNSPLSSRARRGTSWSRCAERNRATTAIPREIRISANPSPSRVRFSPFAASAQCDPEVPRFARDDRGEGFLRCRYRSSLFRGLQGSEQFVVAPGTRHSAPLIRLGGPCRRASSPRSRLHRLEDTQEVKAEYSLDFFVGESSVDQFFGEGGETRGIGQPLG